jgi:hypothetical protein
MERGRDADTEIRTQAPAPALSLDGPDQDTLPVEEEVAFERPPSLLCHFCQEIFNSLDSWTAGEIIRDKPFDHYESWSGLLASSENGCGFGAQMVFDLNQFTFSKLDDQARPSLEGRVLCSRPHPSGWELEIRHSQSWTIVSMLGFLPALTPRKCYISKLLRSTSRRRLIPISLAI